ncbi:ABC transporter permease [Falsarthrobacter nasiphocae]|uniref:Peptide/nickel transport system permease protein n=1 Tax=Falsarthrobacter nasiphocae TaxID=189863 RepID=A0AAE4C8J0_9MICC|nr:ABC transporter permease [Falsarthrobacter nasiphocae]MDR6892465.1 peptide/nickel transport system permease protein [Falsarthrobacter nasiphocae]
MLKYLAKRALTYAVMIFIVTSVTYFIASAVFSPGQAMEARTPRPTQEQVNNALRLMGLDPSLSSWQRYVQWLQNVVFHWDWGRGPDNSVVNEEFSVRVWVSVRLYILGTILSLLVGVALGVISAIRQYKVTDRVLTTYSYLVFIFPLPAAYLLIQFFFIWVNQKAGTNLFYVTGSAGDDINGFWNVLVDQAQHYFVPTIAMTVLSWAGYQVTMRQFLLDNVNTDYVRTARATGLTRGQAITRHAMRVSFIPVAQQIAYVIPGIFIGGFFTEKIFNWQGIGMWTLQAIANQDVNATVATTAFGCCVTAFSFILADFLTVLVDPRVRI